MMGRGRLGVDERRRLEQIAAQQPKEGRGKREHEHG